MARKSKGKGESNFTYFGKIFEENLEWLEQKSCDAPKARFRHDHGMSEDEPIDKKVMDALANTKSRLRKKHGIHVRGKTRKKANTRAPKTMTPVKTVSAAKMESLEDQIDDCLMFAKTLNQQALDSVIRLLKRARNAVIVLRDPPE